LRWLASAQSDDGRWEAALHGAGRERRIGGTDRQGAGATADSAMTGLTLLAFLGAGHTHQSGEYRDTVRRGLEYLLRVQRADGSLAGNARVYEAMYCHGMAAFALSEAAAMTRDEQLKPAVSRAVTFIVASQHPTSGGWRYQPGDPGDTSQLGWQIMALRSAELAGMPMPARTRDGIERFLASVAAGRHRGLASYRNGEQATRTMTAEALASRQFMRLAQTEASREAADFIVQELPGAGEVNLYYWYYATLCLYQLQDEHWEQWNEALQRSLIAAQHTEGDLAGSWDHDTVWGSYGGRVYTTALATLCLEVYYRYLPVYSARAGQQRRVR
jgi:squalene cyclase